MHKILSNHSYAEESLVETGPRIIRMARKPSAEEFKRTSIVCGIGLFVLGAVGFATLLLMDNALPHVFQNWLNIPLP